MSMSVERELGVGVEIWRVGNRETVGLLSHY
jgi:hypothetical protein